MKDFFSKSNQNHWNWSHLLEEILNGIFCAAIRTEYRNIQALDYISPYSAHMREYIYQIKNLFRQC